MIDDYSHSVNSLMVAELGQRARHGFACIRIDREQRRLEPWLERFGADQLVRIRAGA